jgi:nuclear pore complex protein Nup62
MPQGASQLGTSSGNAAQPASSRLKNKSMDEILTRWATDLTKHQKEFQKQATQVAEWDRILVENTDKIGKLLAKTFQAERDASEVEKQLSSVESQQEELDQYLDRYEKEVDDMIQKHGLTPDNAGLDIERERTYVVTTERVNILTHLQVQAGREAYGPPRRSQQGSDRCY